MNMEQSVVQWGEMRKQATALVLYYGPWWPFTAGMTCKVWTWVWVHCVTRYCATVKWIPDRDDLYMFLSHTTMVLSRNFTVDNNTYTASKLCKPSQSVVSQVSRPGAVETRPFCLQWQYEITLPYIIQLQLQSSCLFSKLTTPPSVSPLVPSLISFMPLWLAGVIHEPSTLIQQPVKGQWHARGGERPNL